MTTELSNGVLTISPELRLGYEADNESANVIHRFLNDEIDVSLARDRPRAGELKLFFATAAAAEEARLAFTQPAVWTLNDDVEQLDMTFVRRGVMGTVQQDARLRWVLEVGFQELTSA